MSSERTEEAVNAHIAQYIAASSTAGIAAHLPHRLRKSSVTAA